MTTAAEKKAADAEAAARAEGQPATVSDPKAPDAFVVVRHLDIEIPAVVIRRAAEGRYKEKGWKIDESTSLTDARKEIDEKRRSA